MLTVSNVSKAYGPQELFSGATFRLLPGDRLGLVGPNGAGKTTLFQIILGENEPDEGAVELERDLRLGFLPQESAPSGEETVLQLATSVSPEFEQIHATLREHPDPSAEPHVEALARYIEEGGYTLEAKARRILAGLAFNAEVVEEPANQLSGGWIMRAHLARLLVMEPDLLMLDEPTNHLDLETLGWFQDQLRQYRGAILTISHDRAFLNAICGGILEINHRRVVRYNGNYDQYLLERAAREEQLQAAYDNQQREIAHLEGFVNRFRAQANKASQAQARLKRLEKMERIEAPMAAEATIRFSFPQPPRGGQRVFTLAGVRQAYGDFVVYEHLDFSVERGDRIVLVGPNGAGKSTLLKILGGQVPISAGTREPGLNITSGYFSQQRTETLDPGATVLDEACRKLPSGMTTQTVRSILGAFLISGDAVFKKVKVLSGGEKSRLALVKLLLNPPNLLLLDEPTTHLDIASIDALIEALKDYTGTILFVSHDVHFIRAIAEKVVRIEAGKVTPFAGGYDYYLRKSGVADARAGLVASDALTDRQPTRPSSAPAKPPEATPAREAPAERRRRLAERRRLEQAADAHAERVAKLEREQSSLNERFVEATSGDAIKALHFDAARLEIALGEATEAWEAAMAAVERFDKRNPA